MSRHAMSRIICLLAAVALAAPSGAETLRIGHINTFSGPAAIFGKHQKDAIELALKNLGGKVGGLDVEMIYGDDQMKPDIGKQVAVEMIQRNKVHFVTGIIWSNVLAAVQRQVLRSKTFLISTNAGWSGLAGEHCSPYFFSTSWQNDQIPEAMGKLMADEGVNNVYTIVPNYQAGKDTINGFTRYYKRKTVGEIFFRLGQADFAADLAQIRDAKPDAVFAFAPGGMGVSFVKQWASSGLAGRIKLYEVYTVNYMTLPGIGKAAIGTVHTNFWGPDLDNEANRRFVASFKSAYGYMPSMFSAQAYDMVFLVDSAVRAVKGDLDDKAGMVRAMEKADFPSVRGRFAFNVNHFPIQNFYKAEVVAGPDGNPTIVTRGTVFENHKDAFYKQCKMPPL